MNLGENAFSQNGEWRGEKNQEVTLTLADSGI